MEIYHVSTREVHSKKLKPNKAADCMDITSEYLTFGGTPVVHFLTYMINYIFGVQAGAIRDE